MFDFSKNKNKKEEDDDSKLPNMVEVGFPARALSIGIKLGPEYNKYRGVIPDCYFADYQPQKKILKNSQPEFSKDSNDLQNQKSDEQSKSKTIATFDDLKEMLKQRKNEHPDDSYFAIFCCLGNYFSDIGIKDRIMTTLNKMEGKYGYMAKIEERMEAVLQEIANS